MGMTVMDGIVTMKKELGKNPEIASISLGGERFFHLKHKVDKDLKAKILLENGSLLSMGSNATQVQTPDSKVKNLYRPKN